MLIVCRTLSSLCSVKRLVIGFGTGLVFIKQSYWGAQSLIIVSELQCHTVFRVLQRV